MCAVQSEKLRGNVHCRWACVFFFFLFTCSLQRCTNERARTGMRRLRDPTNGSWVGHKITLCVSCAVDNLPSPHTQKGKKKSRCRASVKYIYESELLSAGE
jgi:hypothetical protein